MKTPHDEPRWSFSAGKCRNPDFVSESQIRVGGMSVFQVRVGAQGRERRGLDARASVGVPYDVRLRESSPGGYYGTPLGAHGA